MNKDKSENKIKVKYNEYFKIWSHKNQMSKLKENKRKVLNVTLSDGSDSEISSSSFDDENSFMAFFISVCVFLKIVLSKSENEYDDNDSEIALVDSNHELSISTYQIKGLK